MNLFERFSLSKEIKIKEGEITLDTQRVIILPISFMGQLSIKLKEDGERRIRLYDSIKNGMPAFAMPIGKEYQLTYNSFLDRWVKYTAFAGWGIAEYQVIEKEKGWGFLHIKGSPLHLYLKRKGIKEPIDVIVGGLIAGSLTSTFKSNIDVIETGCVCNGEEFCTYYWGSREYLEKKFPKIVSRWLGDIK